MFLLVSHPLVPSRAENFNYFIPTKHMLVAHAVVAVFTLSLVIGVPVDPRLLFSTQIRQFSKLLLATLTPSAISTSNLR